MGNSGSELALSLREVAGERPAERASGEIPEADEAEDRRAKCGHAGEASVLENPTMEDGKPDLDLVDPRGVNWRVDEMKAPSMPAIETRPAAIVILAVDIEIVPDDVDLLVGIPLGDGLEKGHQRVRSAALDDMAEDSAAPRL